MDTFSLGQSLRDARTARELTLEEAEAALKIRSTILASFEQGDFNVPGASPVQVKGFLRNYARYLGLDEDLAVQQYTAAIEGSARRRRRQRPTTPPSAHTAASTPITYSTRPASEPNKGSLNTTQRSSSGGLLRNLLFLIVGVGAVAVIILVTNQLVGLPLPGLGGTVSQNATPSPTSSDVTAQLPTLTVTPTTIPLSAGTATLIPRSPQNYQEEALLVTVEFHQRAWVRIQTDGTEVFAGLVAPRELIAEYAAEREIVVDASNAAALLVTYNGQPQNSYGPRGQGVRITYRPDDNVIVDYTGTVQNDVAAIASPAPPISLPTLPGTQGEDNRPTPDPAAPTQLPILGATSTPQSSATPTITAPPNLETSVGQAEPAATTTPSTADQGAAVTATGTNAPNTDTPTAAPVSPLETPTPTAILPPRITQTGLLPTKPAP